MDRILTRQFTLTSFFLFFIAFQACMPVALKKHPHYPPYTDQEIAGILLQLKTQDRAVHTFFSSGTITFQGNGSEFEANSLIVGTRNPYKVKIEITHFWGRPLFHIVIDENKIQILSFPEKLYYIGDIGQSEIYNRLPVHLDVNHLWAIGRGFPFLSDFNRAESLSGKQISLLNKQGEAIQLFGFSNENHLPHKTVLSRQNLEVFFSNFENHNNIPYARKTRLFDQKAETMLELKIKQIVMNKAIDSSIFNITVPTDFEHRRNEHSLDTQ